MNAEFQSRPVRRIVVWVSLALLVVAFVPTTLVAADGVVVLRDRQRIEGKIGIPEDRDALVWQARGFLDPFEFEFDNLQSITWPAKDTDPESETFAVETNDGDLITGDITSIDGDAVRLQSRSLGDFTLPMSRVVRVTRLVDNPTLVFPHLSGLKDWSSPASENVGWEEDGNELVSDSPDATLLGDLDVPERAIFEVELSWVGTPNFHLSLGCDANVSPDQSAGWSITCIGKTLAVFREREQTADLDILSMLDDDSSIRLTAFVDQRRDEISVFATDGTLLGQLKSDGPPDDDEADKEKNTRSGGTGVLLTNRDGTTKLHRLRIADWIGNESNSTPIDAPFTVVMTDAKIIPAQALNLADEGQPLTIKTLDGESQTIPLTSLAGISFDPDRADKQDEPTTDDEDDTSGEGKDNDDDDESPPQTKPSPASALATVLLHDGARFTGELTSISDRKVRLRHRSTFQEVAVDRSAVQRIVWQNAKWHQSETDILRLVATSDSADIVTSGAPLTMQGRLQPSEIADSTGLASLAWQPHGSIAAARFADGISAKISFPELATKSDKNERSARADTAEDANRRIRERIEALRRKNLARRKPNAPDEDDDDDQLTSPEADPASSTADDAKAITYENNLFLRSGDQFVCRVLGSAEQGVLVKPREGQQQVVPHDKIKAIEMGLNVRQVALEDVKRQRLLTLPRLQKDSPPTHMLVAGNGDLLRCRLLGMNADTIRMEIRLEEIAVPRDRVSHIIWLHPEDLLTNKGDNEVSDDDRSDEVVGGSEIQAASDQPSEPNTDLFAGYVQAIMRQGENRLTFQPSGLKDGVIHGVHDVFGVCEVALNDVSEIVLGSQIDATKRQDAYQDWTLTPAKEPLVAAAIRGDMPAPSHPLNGQRAPEVNLPLLDGDRFRLSRHRGEIVVLDFWASWCAPCMQTMPKVDELIAEFGPKRVTLLTINVSDGDAQIRRSLKRLNIRPEVALDVDGVVSERYQANAIPQLVVIDPNGKIKTVLVGGGDVVVGRLRDTIQGLLDAKP